MKILKTEEDFKKFWYYTSSPPERKDFPKSYPCIAEEYTGGGGLAGEFVYNVFTYFPKNVDKDSFILGYKACEKAQRD